MRDETVTLLSAVACLAVGWLRACLGNEGAQAWFVGAVVLSQLSRFSVLRQREKSNDDET